MITVFLLSVTFLYVSPINCDCGLPPKPYGSVLNEVQLRYAEGSEIAYTCDSEYELVTKDTLEGSPQEETKVRCQEGIWTGELPRCALPSLVPESIEIFIGDIIKNSSNVSPKKVISPNNEDPNGCLKDLSSGISKRQSWVLNFPPDASIDIIRLTFENTIPETLVDYESPPLMIFGGDNECELKHATNKGMQFLCDGQDNEDGKITMVISPKLAKLKFVLSTLCFLSFPTDCGAPEIPLYTKAAIKPIIAPVGRLPSDSQYRVVYTCLKYTGSHNNEIVCEKNGLWSGKISPCEPKKGCPLPKTFDHIRDNVIVLDAKTKDSIVYENAENLNGSLVAVPNSIAVYLCKGLSSFRVGERVCTERGKWIGEEPSCKKDWGKQMSQAIRRLLGLSVFVALLMFLLNFFINQEQAMKEKPKSS